MFLMDVNSIKDLNRFRKEINTLSKRISNIYIEKNGRSPNFAFENLKKFVTRSGFEELQLTEIPLNFRTSCCNLKIKGLEAKLCVAFPLF